MRSTGGCDARAGGNGHESAGEGGGEVVPGEGVRRGPEGALLKQHADFRSFLMKCFNVNKVHTGHHFFSGNAKT